MKKFLFGSACLMAAALVQPVMAQTAAADVPKAEDVYKNIKVLNGLPADQLLISMRIIRASLGVACVYCHVEPEGAKIADVAKPAKVVPGWYADEPYREADSPKKEIARKMILMTMAINKQNFGGGNLVTCFTCHRGNAHPGQASNYNYAMVSTYKPPVADAKAVAGVNPDELMDKFVAAVGGADAIEKVKTRSLKAGVQYGSMIAARAAGRAQPHFDVVVNEEHPGKRFMVTSEGNGVVRAFDGDKGWQQGRIFDDPRHQPRDFRGYEADTVRLEDPYFFAPDLKKLVTGLKMTRVEAIDGKDAYVVTGKTANLPQVELYFDKDSGLLVRTVAMAQGYVGRLPTQYDYSDFRTVDGIKMPYKWVSAEIAEGQTYTYTIEDVQQNGTVDESRFTRPAQYIVMYKKK